MRSALVAVIAAVGLMAVTVAQANEGQLHFTGGKTKLVVNPAVVPVLAQNGISLAPVAPATAAAVTWHGQPTVAAWFPISGGRVNAQTLVGIINHRGGLEFSKGARSLKVGLFQISIHRRAYLTAAVGFDRSMRVALARLDLSHAKVYACGHWVTVTGVRAYLTKVAADALDAMLHTNVFTPGLALGVASVHARVG
jgi:hypothetical protein